MSPRRGAYLMLGCLFMMCAAIGPVYLKHRHGGTGAYCLSGGGESMGVSPILCHGGGDGGFGGVYDPGLPRRLTPGAWPWQVLI